LQEITISDENLSDQLIHITSEPKIILKSFFGEKKLYNFTLQFDEENSFFIETQFRILTENETTLKAVRFNELSIESQQECKKFQIDLNPINQDGNINCVIEWKFTNNISKENYLSRVIRKNIFFEFIEPLSLISYSILDVE
jgi:hypothetical protein